MTTKERVLAYLKDWSEKDVDPSNGCHIRYIDDPFGDDGVMAWEVCMKHSRAFIVYDDETYQCDEDFDIAARILRIDNPWRLTSEELPPVNVAVLGRWDDNPESFEVPLATMLDSDGEWYMDYGRGWEDCRPAKYWMPIPKLPK